MNRREARESAMLMIFESRFQPQLTADEIQAMAEMVRDLERDAYMDAVFRAYMENREEIDARIAAFAKGRNLSRISSVALSVMRLSVAEMLYLPEAVGSVPFPISINEALELLKRYDHDVPPAFVNGVLNAIADDAGLKKREVESK